MAETSSEQRQPTRHGAATVGKTAAALLVCAGVAFFGLLGGGQKPATARWGSDPMTGYFDETMPRYPGVTELPAGPHTRVGGSAVRMSMFTCEHEPLKVARFYGDFWRSRGLYVRKDITHKGGVVAAVDPKKDRVYQVLITRSGGRTRAFPSMTTAPLSAMQNEAQAPPVPLYPESEVLLALQSGEAVARARLSLSLNSGSLADNVTHFRRELRAAGYRPSGKPGDLADETSLLVYARPGSEITVSLAPQGEGQTRVHITEIASGR